MGGRVGEWAGTARDRRVAKKRHLAPREYAY